MPTPYKILQLKQKQTKKILSYNQKQRYYSIRYNKNGDNATQYLIQRDRPYKNNYQINGNQTNQRKERKYLNQSKNSSSDKKYEILFRQSIRKINGERAKVYHTNNFSRGFNLFDQRIGSYKQNKNTDKKNQQEQYNRELFKTINVRLVQNQSLGKCQKLNFGKFRILFKTSPQKFDHNQIIPDILVQKCKLNIHQNQSKLKIQKTIQNLYNMNQKISNSRSRKFSFDSSFTQRQDFNQQHQNKLLNFEPYQTLSNIRKSQQTYKSNKNSLQKQILADFGFKDTDIAHQTKTIDLINMGNFIKSKKKKRLPISKLCYSNNQTMYLKRAVTDDLSKNVQRAYIINNPQQGCHSPKKGFRCGAGTKFNTIEQKISGWESYPSENYPLNQSSTIKNPSLQQN